MNKTLMLSGLAAASLAALSACGGGDSTEDTGPKAVRVEFAAVAGDTPITCASTLSGLGTTSASGTLADMRFYIANVKLVTRSGSEVPLVLSTEDNYNTTKGSDTLTLIDLEDKTGTCAGTTEMNASIKGTVPAGDYVGMKMTLGVPLALNHTDQTAATTVTPAVINNAVHPGMAWSWAGGRKFTKIEVTNASWTAPTFFTHLGSTGCTGTNPAAGQVDTCARPDRPVITLASFNPDSQKVAVDVKALLAGNNVTVNGAGPGGCMSGSTDPECPAVFNALGLDLITGTQLATTPTQTLFRAVSK
ncbi:MbnP family copper-binding protein [Ideonella paludis]|uniref:Metallo-mystery pair system four-Cys motif protein n=2 Tax=Ideonella paludis TaxID=1233411 RepID=A0ABS5DZN8_9BURK|nr:MbnP family copper-binding protein [Ideonella paludis]MBQ0936616.1 metallo-mystery pair system four-Cys motif protein [Ideonella paludis]